MDFKYEYYPKAVRTTTIKVK